MLQKIDDNVHLIVADFVSDVWTINHIRDTYISVKPRNDYVIPGGGLLMWGSIYVGAFLMSLPYLISIPLVILSGLLFNYYSLTSRQRGGSIQFRQHHENLICIDAHGVDRKRIKKLSAKYNMNVIFEHSFQHDVRLSSRRYDRRGY